MSQAVLPKPLSSRQLRDEHDDMVLKSLVGPGTVWMSNKHKKDRPPGLVPGGRSWGMYKPVSWNPELY